MDPVQQSYSDLICRTYPPLIIPWKHPAVPVAASQHPPTPGTGKRFWSDSGGLTGTNGRSFGPRSTWHFPLQPPPTPAPKAREEIYEQFRWADRNERVFVLATALRPPAGSSPRCSVAGSCPVSVSPGPGSPHPVSVPAGSSFPPVSSPSRSAPGPRAPSPSRPDCSQPCPDCFHLCLVSPVCLVCVLLLVRFCSSPVFVHVPAWY